MGDFPKSLGDIFKKSSLVIDCVKLLDMPVCNQISLGHIINRIQVLSRQNNFFNSLGSLLWDKGFTGVNGW